MTMLSSCQIGVFQCVCRILALFFLELHQFWVFFPKNPIRYVFKCRWLQGAKISKNSWKLEEFIAMWLDWGILMCAQCFGPCSKVASVLGFFFFKIKSSWRDFYISVATWAKILKNSWKVRKNYGHVIKLGHFNLFVAFWPLFSKLHQFWVFFIFFKKSSLRDFQM